MKLKTGIVAALACLMLVLPAAALAQSPTADAYSGLAGQQQGGGSAPGTEAVSVETAPVEAESGSLPFTGLEVGVIALVGAGLLVGGVALYRISRRPEPLS